MWVAAPSTFLYDITFNDMPIFSVVEADSIKGYIIVQEFDNTWYEAANTRGVAYIRRKKYGSVRIKRSRTSFDDNPNSNTTEWFKQCDAKYVGQSFMNIERTQTKVRKP